MKKSLLILITIVLTLNSCEKLDKDVFFTIGSEHEYLYSDIELYDTSTHTLYFKNEQEYLNDMYENTFAFLDNRYIIYQGSFMPGYSSSIPDGPFIMSPPRCNYALKIENFHSEKTDIRNNPRLIDLLNQHNLLHSGLSISSSSIEINGTQITLNFTIKNQDQSNLMIIDFDKTGTNLFHYFTSGLHIYDAAAQKEIFLSKIEPLIPDPWDSWDIDWLSELKSGDSKKYTITYTINNQLSPGVYETTFHFPGLTSQVTKDQLYQGNSRIWLGDITLKKSITIQ